MEAEKQTANILLKRGVPVQLVAPLFLRLIGIKHIKLIMRLPTLTALLKITKIYLSLNVEVDKDLSFREAVKITSISINATTKIVAISLLDRSPFKFIRPIISRLLRKTLTGEEINNLYQLILLHGGLEDFINTIRLIEMTRVTKPMNLSPSEQRS